VLNSPLAPDLVGPDAVVPSSEAGYGTAFLHGEIKLLNRDDLLTSSSPILNWLLDGGVQSVCFLPLVTNRGTLGTLNLGSNQDNAFAPEIKFLKHVADQIAIALDNAAAHREIAELSARLKEEKLYLQDEISSALNFEEIVGESPA